MRPVDDDRLVVEERVVRRSHRHRTWLRVMARARRWTRRFRRSILVTILLLVAGILAVAQTGRGQGLALDVALGRLEGALSGELTVGGVRSGTLFSGATLTDVRLETSDGRPFLTADSVVLSYSIPAAVIGGPPIRSTIIWGLDLEISKYTEEQPLNLTRLVAPGAPKPDSATRRPATPFSLGRVGIREGHVTILTPTDDPDARRVVTGPEGELLRSIVFEDLSVDVEDAAVAPGNAIEFEARLASFHSDVQLVDEPIRVREAFGSVTYGRQGIRITDGAFRLPSTLVRGGLNVGPRRSGAPWTFRADFTTDGWGDLADVRWVEPRIPEGRFRGRAGIDVDRGVGLDLSGMEVELEASNVVFDGGARFTDRMTMRGLRVQANPVVLDRLEPWLERELPLDGWLSGDATFDGTLDDVRAEGRVTLVPTGFGGTPSTVDFTGRVRREGSPGAEALAMTLNPLNYDVLDAFLPQFPWAGTGSAVVELDGPLREGMRMRGDFAHTSPDGLESRARVDGTLARDSSSGVWNSDLDVDLLPLSLGILREALPSLDLTGEVAGQVALDGPFDALRFDAVLDAGEGEITVAGSVDATDPASRYRLGAEADAFPLSAVTGRLPAGTRWSGSLDLIGSGIEPDSMTLAATAVAGRSRFGDVRVDTLATRLRVTRGVLTADSVRATLAGIDISGRGRLGLAEGRSGSAQFEFSGPSLVGLRPVLMGVPDTVLVRDDLTDLDREFLRLQGVDPDTLPAALDVRVDGSVQGSATVTGRVQDFELGMIVDVFEGAFRANEVDTVLVGLTATGLPARTGSWQIGATARGIRYEGRTFDRGGFEADVVQLEGQGRVELVRRAGEAYRAAGDFALDSVGGWVELSDGSARLGDLAWILTERGRIQWDSSTLTVERTEISREGGDPMSFVVGGILARGGESDFRVDVQGLHIERLMQILQIDDPEVGGHLDLQLALSGPAESPRIDGNLAILGARYETIGLTRVAGTLGYESRRLEFDLGGWDGVRRRLALSGTFPVDLALQQVEERVVDAPMDVRLRADSLDAAIALSYVTALEGVVGTVTGDVTVGGRPSDPEPEGVIRLADAAWSIEAVGVRHSGVEGELLLREDRTVEVSLHARGVGSSDVSGTLLMEPFANPELDLTFDFNGFQAVRRPDMEGAISGSFTLDGRYRRPTVQGALSVDAGTIYVDELQRAAGVVNLSDPYLLDPGLAIDTTALASQPIFADLTNPFFDNLRVDVDLEVPRGNWLRSIDTNAELVGNLIVLYDRQVDDFVLIGELQALRGSHRVLGRSFELEGGTVNFIGRPGMNPDLSIQASTRIRRPDDAPFRVNAEVGGSLLRPVVTLTTEEAGLAEEDLVSYLVFGQPSGALGGAGRSQLGGQRGIGTVAQGAATFIGGTFANQFGTAIAQELGAFSLDYVSVQQGGAAQSLGQGNLVGDTQVELGRYVGDDLFLIMVLRPFDTGPQDQNTVAGVRVEWALTDNYNSEFFFEDRFLRSSSQLLGSSSGLLENQRVLGLFLFKEWGYGSGPASQQDR
jgi:hypothetical protein